MIVTFLRSSSVGAEEFCEARYLIEYQLGYRGASNLRADLGTVCHKVLEILALCKKGIQDNKRVLKDEEGVVADIRIRDYIGTNENIDTLIDEVYAYYSTHLTDHPWAKKDLKECREWVWKVINAEIFDPRNRDIVDAEPHFDIEILRDWSAYSYTFGDDKIDGFLRIKGTIDLITKVSEDTYEIIDWKTGKRMNWATGEEKTHAKLQDDFQLRLYHYAASYLYPNIKHVIVTINFINDGGPFTLIYDKSDLPKTEQMIKKRFEKIRNNDAPQVIAEERRYVTFDNGFRMDKCKKLCHFGKNSFEGTHVQPIVNATNNRLTKQGEKMSMCEQLQYLMKYRSLDSITKNVKNPNFQIGHYHAPGSVTAKEE